MFLFNDFVCSSVGVQAYQPFPLKDEEFQILVKSGTAPATRGGRGTMWFWQHA